MDQVVGDALRVECRLQGPAVAQMLLALAGEQALAEQQSGAYQPAAFPVRRACVVSSSQTWVASSISSTRSGPIRSGTVPAPLATRTSRKSIGERRNARISATFTRRDPADRPSIAELCPYGALGPHGRWACPGDDPPTDGDVAVVWAHRISITLPIMERVRWGIIGVGNVTEGKSGPAFQQAERSELVAVMRRNGDLAADYARRHHVPRWYDDADELINDPEVDAVYVATPPDSHRDYAVRAAQAGKPVYVEKPMARTALECEAMIAACDDAGVGLFVAYYRRAMPRFATVKELLDSGRIGQLRSVSIRNERPGHLDEAGRGGWRVDPEISGGGHFVDLGSHTLDLLDWALVR